jgi:hypothetical protein
MESKPVYLASLIDAFVAAYQGRDPSLLTRLDHWKQSLGHVAIATIDSDTVESAMVELAERACATCAARAL